MTNPATLMVSLIDAAHVTEDRKVNAHADWTWDKTLEYKTRKG